MLITGSSGYLGRNIYRRLHDGGWSPVGLRHRSIARGHKTVPGDVLDPASLGRAMKGVDSVVHCAAVVGSCRPLGDYAVNSDGTRNALKAACRAGVRRFVHISSLAVMDEYRDHHGDDERTPAPHKFRDRYAWSKAEAERDVLEFKDKLNTIILRPGWIWGPGDPNTHELLSRLSKGRFAFIGDGSNIIYLTYIDNMVDAVLLALANKGITSGDVFNITDGGRTSMEEFVSTITSVTGATPVKRHIPRWAAYYGSFMLEKLRPGTGINRQNVSILSRNLHFSIEKARKELGYRPDTSLEAHVRAADQHVPDPAKAEG